MTEIEALKARELWRFADLTVLGIVNDRATLRRWMATEEFPKPIVLSANSIAWRSDEVRAWLDRRPRGRAPQPPRPARDKREAA